MDPYADPAPAAAVERPSSRQKAFAAVLALVDTALVTIGWLIVALSLSIASDTGDDSKNGGAAAFAIVLALVLVAVTWLVVLAWSRPAQRLRLATWALGAFVAGLAALLVGVALS